MESKNSGPTHLEERGWEGGGRGACSAEAETQATGVDDWRDSRPIQITKEAKIMVSQDSVLQTSWVTLGTCLYLSGPQFLHS